MQYHKHDFVIFRIGNEINKKRSFKLVSGVANKSNNCINSDRRKRGEAPLTIFCKERKNRAPSKSPWWGCYV